MDTDVFFFSLPLVVPSQVLPLSQKEYDTLLKRYGKLEETYKELLSLYKRQEEKLEKIYRRNRAGRKSKMTEELTVKLGVSTGLVHKILHL